MKLCFVAICKCAEVFPSENDIQGTSNDRYLSPDNSGETRIFTAMGFHCQDVLTMIIYKTRETSCQTMSSNISSEHSSNPEFQLWRRNGSMYELELTQELIPSSSELTLGWNITNDHVIGLWIPSNSIQCSDTMNQDEIQIGHIANRTIKGYRLIGYQRELNGSDYELKDYPMPKITVMTGKL